MRCIYQTFNLIHTHTVRVISPNTAGDYAVRVAEFLSDGSQANLSCAGTYYTPDRDDAIQTAQRIADTFQDLQLETRRAAR